mmetsp:Transcript_42449/g.76058  ORF Transcript_42449/g.76058 Transcript_42449/m.76058 type:complete len:119 (+) Transcript_42449:340-696(+)
MRRTLLQLWCFWLVFQLRSSMPSGVTGLCTRVQMDIQFSSRRQHASVARVKMWRLPQQEADWYAKREQKASSPPSTTPSKQPKASCMRDRLVLATFGVLFENLSAPWAQLLVCGACQK